MSEEMLINVSPLETRVAVVDDGMLQAIQVERSAHRGIVDNIYLGRVVRVLPGMQSAFVDIGEQRTSFIHASDITPLGKDGLEDRHRRSDDIRDLLREGQDLLVQVSKEPIGSKGARLTTRISVSSRYLVYTPRSSHIGVSQQIDDSRERDRLRDQLQRLVAEAGMEEAGGFILRTAAEGVGEPEIAADLRFLERLWQTVLTRASEQAAPRRLYEDWQLYHRAIRDMARSDLSRILIDSAETFAVVEEFCRDFVPEVAPLLEHYRGESPLFDRYRIEDEIDKALQRKVELKSGGYLIIDQTEAMTTIDVNTGAFVGRSNAEETRYKTNLEAAAVLARQLRLRNLGGIIIIDFIDMKDPEHRRQLTRTLEKALESDPAPTTVSSVSELGLVQMTRKRTRDSLEHSLCESCPVCDGRGMLKSAETICHEIFREILCDARARKADELMVQAAQGVVDRLLDEESASVAALEVFAGKTIQLRVEPRYSQERFDILLL
jgi:ribonuclease G